MYVEHVCLVSGGPSSESGLSGYLIRAIKQGGGDVLNGWRRGSLVSGAWFVWCGRLGWETSVHGGMREGSPFVSGRAEGRWAGTAGTYVGSGARSLREFFFLLTYLLSEVPTHHFRF